jgi:hypothetical protein
MVMPIETIYNIIMLLDVGYAELTWLPTSPFSFLNIAAFSQRVFFPRLPSHRHIFIAHYCRTYTDKFRGLDTSFIFFPVVP